MAQLTVRLGDELAEEVKVYASALGRSVNSWVVAVLKAAVDPELADSDVERTRARLARAGLLVTPTRRKGPEPPEPESVRKARRAVGGGRPLSELVSDGRG